MPNTNVVEESYEKLQAEIEELIKEWRQSINETAVVKESSFELISSPLIPQLDLAADMNQYHRFIIELFGFLAERQPGNHEYCDILKENLTIDIVSKWFKEVVAVNRYYFHAVAEQYQVPEWLPLFAAEQAARPFLQKAAAELETVLSKFQHDPCCPACGEPSRFAVVGKKGKKELKCPRCLHSREEKKLRCAHCGTEDHTQMVVMKVDGEEGAEIHGCQTCKGYTKVIDMRKLLKKETPALMDIKTIHLDYIAQEKGFGTAVDGKYH
ncbi:formate dehydrogenase accessory protein FdhE [Bacillus mesophilum]|uniref:Formate dehydrogenase accessory protein FdhE n=1 Tax=Bacillus mesophilum TaxID=1071718 RepID=A0A7V7UX89_9BACI|nr:formate dehydrogenase accessory protein FdhE [Bacillus mesophilum]KAB2332443.1 formate dehydrogenase accessory protein FdhE [Bacillus mesophilum]